MSTLVPGSTRTGASSLTSRAATYAKDAVVSNQYRVIFVGYTILVSIVSSCLMFLLLKVACPSAAQHRESFFYSWFTAISSFSCTGLIVSDVTQWCRGAQWIILLTIEFGSLPLCAAMPSMLRARRLKQLTLDDLPRDERRLVSRHYAVSIAVVWVCVAYWFLVQLVAFILLVGEMGPWWSIFHVGAGFNNAGFALDSRSFAYPELAGNTYVVLVFILLMPMGNTLFPVALRHTVHAWKFLLVRFYRSFPSNRWTPRWIFLGLTAKELADAIRELLRYPQEYFTHLFSREQSWYLFVMWIILTTVDYLMFIPEYKTGAFATHKNEWLQALFQTVTVRTTGFTIMDLTQVQLGHIGYWILSMYLSSYPFMISQAAARKLVRAESDEEQETFPIEDGVDGDGDESKGVDRGSVEANRSQLTVSTAVSDGSSLVPIPRGASASRLQLQPQGVTQNLRDLKTEAGSTVATEIGWLFLAAIVISYAENVDLNSTADASPFTRILFEVSSAYGTVGLSLSSASNPAVSFSGVMSTLSQVVIMLVMYFGKFRGLPQTVELDRTQHLINRHRSSILRRRRSISVEPIHHRGDLANHFAFDPDPDLPLPPSSPAPQPLPPTDAAVFSIDQAEEMRESKTHMSVMGAEPCEASSDVDGRCAVAVDFASD